MNHSKKSKVSASVPSSVKSPECTRISAKGRSFSRLCFPCVSDMCRIVICLVISSTVANLGFFDSFSFSPSEKYNISAFGPFSEIHSLNPSYQNLRNPKKLTMKFNFEHTFEAYERWRQSLENDIMWRQMAGEKNR